MQDQADLGRAGAAGAGAYEGATGVNLKSFQIHCLQRFGVTGPCK